MVLLYLTQEGVLRKPIHILDMAPRQCLSTLLKNIDKATYISSDLNSPSAMVLSDLTGMGFKNDSFDLIICLHIMEHIFDDHAAYLELHRLLKPGGLGLLMVPLSDKTTIESATGTPEDNEKLFGQFDHVRYYGLDIEERMRSAGLEVEIIDMFTYFSEQECTRYALYGDDRFLIVFRK
jgi:SAM-dependent methyltransferase